MAKIDIEHKFAIMELLYRYNRMVDLLDFQGWADCFTRNGVFEGAYRTFRAHDDLELFKFTSIGIMDAAPNIRHFVTNIEIEITGETARCESFLLLTTTANATEAGAVPDSRIIQSGVYFDDLVIENGSWRIRHRRVQVDGATPGKRPIWSDES